MASRARKSPSAGSKPDKLMRDSLMLALREATADADGKPTKRLRLVASALVKRAEEGDVPAIREIFDRIDGKSVQPLQHDVSNTLEELLDRLTGQT
jgi:hypothetical protein